MGFIFKPLLKLLWMVLIQGPLQLINVFDEVFKFLTSGVFYDILFGGKEFDMNKIPAGFYIFCGVAIFAAIMIFIIQYLTLLVVEEKSLKDRLIQAFKSSMKGILFTIIIPVCFFLACVFLEFMQNVINVMFGGSENTFAKMLYKLGDPSWDGLSTDGIKANFAAPDNIMNYNIIVEIIGVWMMAYTIFMVGLAVSSKIFELYCLFLVGPIFAATMPNDDGARMKQWRDASMGKMFITIGSLLVYNIFIVVISLLVKIVFEKFDNEFARMLLTIILLLGGGVFVQTMPTFFATFFNESVGAAEGRASIRQAMAGGGMLKAGGLGLLSAIGIGKTARARREVKNKQRMSKFNSRVNPFGSGGSSRSAGGIGNNNDPSSFENDPTQPAPAAAAAMRGVGAIGLAGSLVRTTATVFGAGKTAGAGVGALFGNKRGKARVKQAWRGISSGFTNSTQILGLKTAGVFKRNTVEHRNRHGAFEANYKEGKYINELKDYKSGMKSHMLAANNQKLDQETRDWNRAQAAKMGKKAGKTYHKLTNLEIKHELNVKKRDEKIGTINQKREEVTKNIQKRNKVYKSETEMKSEKIDKKSINK